MKLVLAFFTGAALAAYSRNGQCGPQHNNLLCDPDSAAYHGSCCSHYGWCGDTDAHCGVGCVSGCSSSASSSILPPTTATGEPVLGQGLSTSTAGSKLTGSATSDGSCGQHYGNTICGDWYKGSCCSMYGFCGNTSAHCGEGCQSGPCSGNAQKQGPGPVPAPPAATPGMFNVVGLSGVPAMHAALLENGHIVFLDKVENYTQLKLDNGQYAYSSEWDPGNPGKSAIPIAYSTNAFCSGGIFLPDGRLINIGGNAPLAFIDPTVGSGFDGLRYLRRSATDSGFNGQSWSEPGNKLDTARWYASAQILPDGRVFVASGSLNGLDPALSTNNNPTFEMLDQNGISNGQSVPLDILVSNQPYYMYPFVHLLKDGSLFIFVSKSAEQFDVSRQTTLKTYSDLPGMYRTYPNTGGSVILPFSSGNDWNPDVVVCGGGAYQALDSPSDASCGRINPLDEDSHWEMESMPEGRVMVEGTLLPDGTVIWMNGCSRGAQGFGLGAEPAYEALLYDPSQALGHRFSVGAPSTIPRLYHSVALLDLDGTVIVTGSNPVEQPILTASPGDPYVTEFRIERYTPPYLMGDRANQRPYDIVSSSTTLVADGSTFGINYSAPVQGNSASIVLYYGGFVTHSLHMGQRMISLDNTGFQSGSLKQTLKVTMPPNRNIAPPGPYVLYVLQDGVPGYGQFVTVA